MPDQNLDKTPKKVSPTTVDKNSQINKEMSDTYEAQKQLLSNFGNIVNEGAHDPYAAARPYTYDPKSTTDINKNFEHYHSHPSFNKLGFNPWADNETLYNEQGSKLGDIWRATKAAAKLTATGALSPLRSYRDFLNGETFTPDYKSAQEMAYLNTVGSSSRGGVTGFTSNLITNSGYTAGLVGEMIAETALTGLIIGETEGAAAPIALAKYGKDLGKFTNAVKGIGKTVAALKDFNVAKAVWQGTKTVGNLINPLEHTLESLKGLKNYEELLTVAKASKTAGAFFKDVQMANATLSEAKMEGASAQIDLERELISDYKAAHGGKGPSQDELLRIKDTASEAGMKTLAWNIPTIFLTNKITFDPLMKSFSKPSEFVMRNGVKFMEKEGEGLVEATFKNRLKASLKPKNLLTAPLIYFKNNFSEGLQETAQEIISGTAKDYYTGIYKSAGKQGHDFGQGENYNKGVWESLAKNTTDQFSGKGFETFASGFFMGGLIHAVSSPVRATQAGYREYKQQRSAYTTATLNSLNEIYKNPLKYFGANIINFANGTEAVAGQKDAQDKGSHKEWLDHENSNLVSQVVTALDTNTYDVFLDKLRTIKSMDAKGIKEAYGVDGQEVLSKIDKVIERAEKVKDNYEKWNERYDNPFDYTQYKKGTPEYNKEAIAYSSWEHAKRLAVFNESSFERNTDRIQSLTNDILQTGNLKNISANDVSLLFSPQSIKTELSMIDDEIAVLEDSTFPADRKTLLQKKTKRNRLEKLHDRLQGYYFTQNIDQSKEGENSPLGDYVKTNKNQLRKAYEDYIGHLATTQANVVAVNGLDLDVSFQKFLDIHDLKQDNIQYAQAINIMADPASFVEQHTRLNKVFSDLYNNREELLKESIENAHSKIEDNTLLSALYARGFVLSPENAEKLLKEKKVPDEFFDINAKQVVDRRDPLRFKEFEDIIKNYVEVTKKDEPVKKQEEKAAEKAPETSDAKATETPAETAEEKEANPFNFDINERFAQIKTGEQLKDFVDELDELIIKSTNEQRKAAGVSSKIFDKLIKDKEQELANEVSIENLNTGDVVEGTGEYKEKKMMVVSKNKNAVVFRDLADKNFKVTVKKENLKSVVKYKYSEEMTNEKTNATPQEVENTKKNVEQTDKFISNNEEVLKGVLADAFADEKKFEDEFENELGCK